MSTVYEIIQELNENNGSNYKMDVLRKHSDNELLQRVLKMTYDNVVFTYGVTMKNVDENQEFVGEDMFTLSHALDILENELVTRKSTGHAAIATIENLLLYMHPQDSFIIRKVIDRDLKINMGRSNINKVFKNLIVKPVYMRCGIYTAKTASKINFDNRPFVQLKADGTYREFKVVDGEVSCISRQGEEYKYPELFEELEGLADGHYIGELTVHPEDGEVMNRALGNGLINSDNPPHGDIVLDVWDHITLKEYGNAKARIKNIRPYHERFHYVQSIFGQKPNHDLRVRTILSHRVTNIKDAMKLTVGWMEEGLEGAIIKDADAVFRDGTSPQQLKLKLEIDVDVRITGFKEGTPGTKREKTFGSIQFANDDGTIKGYAGGIPDKYLEDFNSRREELIGSVMSVQCNDLTQARGNDYHALSHPRFIELRLDKDDTDTLERAMELKEMAMSLGG